MKRIISAAIVLTLVLSSFSFVFAAPWKSNNGNGGFIPPGLAKKGGLPPGIAKQIIRNADKYDWSEDAIKKIEAILEELENKRNIQEEYEEYEGEIRSIDSDYDWIRIELEDEDYEKRFYLSSDVEIVFKDGERAYLEDLEQGDEVEILLNEYGRVIYIKIDRELKDKEYEGRVIAIDKEGFSLYALDKIIDFEIEDDFDINFKDKKGYLENLRIGDEVKVIVEDDEVIKIILNRNRGIPSNIIHGKLIDIYSATDQIVVKTGAEYKIYTLDDDVKIYLNTDRVSLSKLEKEDNISLEMYREKVIEIKAYRY